MLAPELGASPGDARNHGMRLLIARRSRPLGAIARAITRARSGRRAGREPQVRQAWSNLKGALVAGNAGKFCALLSDQARAQLLVQIAAVSPASTCAAAANTFFDITRDARAQAAKAKLTSVTVHRDQATTTDTTGPPPNSWIKVQGNWQLASFPSSGTS